MIDQVSTRRIIVGITGASGSIYGIRALQVLSAIDGIATHLVMSSGAATTLGYETDWTPQQVANLADEVHTESDLAAPVASGSFRVDGMIIAPCSMRTLSGVANSFADNLVVRAADVCLKERRPLVLMVRESPLHRGHLRLMDLAARAGAVVFPPVPSMYVRPATIEELVDHTIMRALDQLGIETGLSARWGEPQN